MITLQISCHALSHTIAYGDDRAAAEAELAKLTPLLGIDGWGRNGEDPRTHKICCPTGDVTVVLSKVEVARLIDSDADFAVHRSYNDETFDREIERQLVYRRRLSAEGFLEKPSPSKSST